MLIVYFRLIVKKVKPNVDGYWKKDWLLKILIPIILNIGESLQVLDAIASLDLGYESE